MTEDRAAIINKITAYLGFAIKSGAVSFGLDALKNAGGSRLALIDEGLSDKSKKEAAYFADKKKIPLILTDRLSLLVHRENVKIVIIGERNLAERIQESFKKLSEVKEHE